VLAASTIYVAFKIIEQLKEDFPLEEKIKELQEILNIPDKELIDCATKILNLAKNFEKSFPSYKNLKKFHQLSFSDE